MDIWLFQHFRFCTMVRGMELLAARNGARYISDHFYAWQRVVEGYFRREIIVQQSAIRRAYILAGIVFQKWKLLEGGIPVGDLDQLDKVHVKQIQELKIARATTKTFQSMKALVAASALQKKAAEVLCHKVLVRLYGGRAYHAWREDKEFTKFAGRVCRIFERRVNLRLLQSWKCAHQIHRKIKRLNDRLKEQEVHDVFTTWRDGARKYKKVREHRCF